VGAPVRLTFLSSVSTPLDRQGGELAQISSLLSDSNCRLLTLLGPGGIGKTRLAIAAARRSQNDFAQGVYFVPLQPVNTADFIVPRIAEAVHLQFYPGTDTRQQLLEFFREKSLLLVLDNFEHLLDGVDIVSEILASAPDVKVLTTSRERLKLLEEWVLEVSGLSFPQGAREISLTNQDALQLFLENACRIRVGFELSDTQRIAATRICQLVGGIPLGIELASAWVRTLTCEDIAAEIERSLDILATSTRNAPVRHRDMRAVFDSSWNLLSPTERAVFTQLSVFRSSLRKEAAQSVAGASLQTLSGLVDKSLLRLNTDGRYELHELLRQFGEEKLKGDSNVEAQTRDRYSVFYADLMRQREPDLKGRRQREALDEITADFDNVRAAWDGALRQRNYQALDHAVEGLFLFCLMRGRVREGKELLLRTEAQLADETDAFPRRISGRALTRGLWLWRHFEGETEYYQEVSIQVDKNLTLVRLEGDKAQTAFDLFLKGVEKCNSSDFVSGATFLKESLALFSEIGDNFYAAWAADWLGVAYGSDGDRENMVKFAQHSLDLRRAIGDQFGTATALQTLGAAALQIGRYDEAKHYFQDMGEIYTELGGGTWIARAKGHLALVAFQQGDFPAAQALAEETRDILHGASVSLAEGLALAYTVLGLLAGLEEDYVRMERWFQLGDARVHMENQLIRETGLALAACGMRDYAAAKRYFLMALPHQQRGDLRTMTVLLPTAAVLLAHEEQAERAVEVLGLAFHHPASARRWLEQWALLTRLRADLEAQLGAEAYTQAWERGTMSSLETVIAALPKQFQPEDETQRAPQSSNRLLVEPLSERELDVLHLIAAGASNQEIAQQLVIGMSTVKKHINHLFAKLGVESRTQALVRARALNLL
jgi:predicted ATPase/DNA-binding CsgD family transcriptional regulator